VQVIHSASHRNHDPPIQVEAGHRDPMQETPRRIDSIEAALGRDARFAFVEPPEVGRGPIDAVHEPAMVTYLERAFRTWSEASGFDVAIPDVFLHPGLRAGMAPIAEPQSALGALGFWCFETTTPIVAGTYSAARGAVDCAVSATDIVLGGSSAAYGLCRPPGHHAATSVFGGYCFFNNAAVAAQYARDAGVARVAILDVDFHHGNGTQQIFYDRPDVFYASLHGHPARAYPYFVGYSDETGAGAGRDTNLNIPLPAATDDDRYLEALVRALDAIGSFAPELLIVSLGLDLYGGDPLGDFAITTPGIAAIGATIHSVGWPTVIIQEGGYAVDELGLNALAFLDAFA
jgi:acetoin utilization deacetylase AcuC-like enzyme